MAGVIWGCWGRHRSRSGEPINRHLCSLHRGRALRDGDKYGMVIGQGVAKSLDLAPGDRVAMVVSLSEGAVNTLDFEVIGVFRPSRRISMRAPCVLPCLMRGAFSEPAPVHKIIMVLNETEKSSAAAERSSRLAERRYGGNALARAIGLYGRPSTFMTGNSASCADYSDDGSAVGFQYDQHDLVQRTRELEPSWPLAARLLRCSGKSFWRVLVGACGALLGMAGGQSRHWEYLLSVFPCRRRPMPISAIQLTSG